MKNKKNDSKVEKVYCIQDYESLTYGRSYKKYKTYYIKDEDGVIDDSCIFVFINVVKEYGLWFEKERFYEIFTLDSKIMREEKLKRIVK